MCDNWLCYSAVVGECARRRLAANRRSTTASRSSFRRSSQSSSDHHESSDIDFNTDTVAPLQGNAAKPPAKSIEPIDCHPAKQSLDIMNGCTRCAMNATMSSTHDSSIANGGKIQIETSNANMSSPRSRSRQLRDFLGFRKHSSTSAHASVESNAANVSNAMLLKKRDGMAMVAANQANDAQSSLPIRPATELPTRKYSYNVNGKCLTLNSDAKNSLNASLHHKRSPTHTSTSGLSLVAVTADWFGDLLRRRRKSAEPTSTNDTTIEPTVLRSAASSALAPTCNQASRHKCEHCQCHLMTSETDPPQSNDRDIEQVHKFLVEKSIQTVTDEGVDCSIDCTDAAFNLNRLSIEVDSRKQSCSSTDSASIVSIVAANDYANNNVDQSDGRDRPIWACRLADPIEAIFGSKPETVTPMDTTQWVEVGKQMVDYIANYIQTIDHRRVTPNIEPGKKLSGSPFTVRLELTCVYLYSLCPTPTFCESGYLKPLMPDSAPIKPQSWPEIMRDFERLILPGVTHWQHPRFHAYFPAGNSYPSILADMIGNAIGCLGFSWVSVDTSFFLNL